MKEYFTLQYRMASRRLTDFGLEPILGCLLILACFTGFSLFLFYKTEFAQYIYILISLALTSRLSETGRNDFLKLCFVDRNYISVRIIENLTSSMPFLAFLVYKQLFISAVILVVISLVLGLNIYKKSLNFTIPTPFYKRPFEFTVGFRNTFFIFPIAYMLTFISISVGNFNLGIFSLLVVFFTTLGFYLKPENEYFVWSFALTPKQFMIGKIRTAIAYTFLLSLPIILALGLAYFENIYALLAFYCTGCMFLITVILAKYSVYPEEMNLPEGILIAVSISFPPILLLLAPYFYIKANNKLQRYLA
ncbi:MAG: ABC transporter permease [Bacteroidota bacterium]